MIHRWAAPSVVAAAVAASIVVAVVVGRTGTSAVPSPPAGTLSAAPVLSAALTAAPVPVECDGLAPTWQLSTPSGVDVGLLVAAVTSRVHALSSGRMCVLPGDAEHAAVLTDDVVAHDVGTADMGPAVIGRVYDMETGCAKSPVAGKRWVVNFKVCYLTDDLGLLLDGHILSARVLAVTTGAVLDLKLDPQGTAAFSELTRDVVGRPEPMNQIAVMLGDRALAVPRIADPITAGVLEVSGDFTAEEASRYAQALTGSPFPPGATVTSTRT